VGIAVHNIPC